jgi:hypothetical protein
LPVSHAARMTRGVLAAALGLLSLVVVLPAGADDARLARGAITALDSGSISVVTDRAVSVTCALRDRSPSLQGFTEGDRVTIACKRVRRVYVLARIRHVRASLSSDGEVKTVTFGGAITALDGSSISLHDGDRDITCAITDASPSTGSVKVGDHLRVVCKNGVLASVTPVTPAPKPPEPAHEPDAPTPPLAPTTHALTGAIGSISVLGDASVTVHNAEHDLTCSLGASSPKLGDYRVGDRVKVLCTDGALTSIARVE